MRASREHFADIWSTLVLTGVCLYAIQYLTLRRLRDFVLSQTTGLEVAEIREKGVSWILANIESQLTPLDYALVISLLATLAYLIYSEVASRRLSEFFDHLRVSKGAMVVFLALISALVARSYLNPGQVFMGDAETHTIRSWMVAEHLRNLSVPVWTNYWYGGMPLLEFYAPGFFVIVGALSLPLGDIETATKVVLWTSHVGSTLTMYLYTRELIRNRLGAMLGALVYTFVFHRMHIVLYQGDLQLSLIFLIYPLLFYFLERHFNGPSTTKGSFLLFVAAVSALILSHHGYAFFAIIFFYIYLVVRTMTSGLARTERLKALAYFTLGLGCATLACAFLLVPFILDQAHVRGMPDLPFALLIPNPLGPTILLDMFDWTPVPEQKNVGYLGVTILIMALISAAWSIHRKVSTGLAASVSAVIALFMVQSFLQYNVKNVNFFVFFAAALCTFLPRAFQYYLQASRRFRHESAERSSDRQIRMLLIVMALLVIEVGPLTVQNVYREGYTFKQELYDRMLKRGPAHKVIERQITEYDAGKSFADQFVAGKLGVVSAFRGLQTPLGYFHEGAGMSFGYNAEITKNLHRDLNRSTISEESLGGMALLGVKYLVFRDRFRYFPLPVPPSSEYSYQDEILELHHTRPLVMSSNVISVSELSEYDPNNIIDTGKYFDPQTFDYDNDYYRKMVSPIVSAMSLDRERGTARALVARADVTALPLTRTDERPNVRIHSAQVEIDSVSVRYEASRDGFGRLAYTYFPYLQVTVDGRPAAFFASAMNYIIAELPAGAHTITISGVASPVRKGALIFSLVFIVILVLLPARLFRMLGRAVEEHSADRAKGSLPARN